MKYIKKYWIWIGIVVFVGSLVLGLYIYHWEYREPVLDVYFFSLNRGRAVFIRTPENMTILIGGGQNSEVIRELTKVMPFYRRHLDMIITPSAVPAQIGGLIEILDRYSVGEIFMPRIMATSTVLDQLKKEIRSRKIHVNEVERGDRVEIGGVNINTLFPYENYKFNKTSLPELGISISYGSTTAYLLGNLSKTIQKDILKNTEIGKHDQNIVEFYNSAGESKVSSELLEKINPRFTWSTKEKTIHFVSDGEGWAK